jgi:hypothetical protein
LSLAEEVDSGRLDTAYYKSQILIAAEMSLPIVVCDIDGVVSEEGYDFASNKRMLQILAGTYPHHLFIFITGREHMPSRLVASISHALSTGSTMVIYNNKNAGKSSRVLKEFCLLWLLKYFDKFDFIDDRLDVMAHLLEKNIVSNVSKWHGIYRDEVNADVAFS